MPVPKKKQLTLGGASPLAPGEGTDEPVRVARNRRFSPQERKLTLLAHAIADLARSCGQEGWVDVLEDEFGLSETLSATPEDI